MIKGFRRIYHGESRIDFIGKKKIWFLLSLVVIVAGIISLFTRGLNFSIDFAGGTSWQFPASHVSLAEVRSHLSAFGISDATVEKLGSGKSATILVEAKVTSTKGESILNFEKNVAGNLAKIAHLSENEISISEVGSTWGSQITDKAIEALIIFFIALGLFIIIFFEWRMAVSAMIAVIHDILITVGIYSLSGFEVTPDTVVAFLTILGYSLYDTMVIFDRVRENIRTLYPTGRYSYRSLVNLSLNQVIARSINTSLVAILPILSVLTVGANLLGATTLQYFGLALVVGLTTGAYSSIFIATPLLDMFKSSNRAEKELIARLKAKGQLVAVALSSETPKVISKKTDALSIEEEANLAGEREEHLGQGELVSVGQRPSSYRRRPPSRAKRKRKS